MSSNYFSAGMPAALLAMICCAVSSAALAQALPPDAAAQDSLAQRFESATGNGPATRDGLSAMVTGYEDLILLERRKFFTAWGSLSPQYTSNASLTPDGNHDYFAFANLGIQAATILAGKVNVHAGAGLLSTRYRDYDELDYSALTGNIGVDRDFQTSIGRINLGAEYSPAVIYDRRFSDRQQTRNRFSGSVQLITSLAEFSRLENVPFAQHSAVIPSLTVERVLTNPSDYEYTGVNLELTFLYRPLPAWQMGVSVGGFWRNYDDYFEGLIGRSRRDDGVRAAVYGQWLPLDFVTISIGADYTDNNSTSDVNGYHATTISPAATVSIRF